MAQVRARLTPPQGFVTAWKPAREVAVLEFSTITDHDVDGAGDINVLLQAAYTQLYYRPGGDCLEGADAACVD